mmetsp:Transcript_6613/g.20124  ORF Transcript_6613/g.20124 Transcript_6613/m.20124 type:complete len:222 (+) Transcript_6613:628-1293(+)
MHLLRSPHGGPRPSPAQRRLRWPCAGVLSRCPAPNAAPPHDTLVASPAVAPRSASPSITTTQQGLAARFRLVPLAAADHSHPLAVVRSRCESWPRAVCSASSICCSSCPIPTASPASSARHAPPPPRRWGVRRSSPPRWPPAYSSVRSTPSSAPRNGPSRLVPSSTSTPQAAPRCVAQCSRAPCCAVREETWLVRRPLSSWTPLSSFVALLPAPLLGHRTA